MMNNYNTIIKKKTKNYFIKTNFFFIKNIN